jgi:molybdopterin converting factor small subunit
MELEIKLFASLRKFNPELESIEVDDGITILELFDKAGRHATLDQPLLDGETVAAFPPIAGG